MVLSFRVSELQMLLGFAGRNKSGRKNELQTRALELLRLRSHPVQLKIRELYKTIQADQLAAHQLYSQTGGAAEPAIDQNMHSRNYYTRQGHAQAMGQQQPQSSVAATKDLPPAHQASLPQSQVSARTNPVYPAAGYTSVTPQQRSTSAVYSPYPYQAKVLPPQLQIQQPSQYPVHPDVKLKKLPFFDMLGELLKPSSLMPQGSMRLQESSFMFHLTPQQSTDIASSRDCRAGSKMDYTVQVQMRFCLQETSCEQEDYFPPSIAVKVNGKPCALPNPIPTNKPGVEPKRPPRPVNISQLVKLSPTVGNQIQVTWSADYNRRYAIAVYLVRKLSSSELLTRLKTRGARHSDYTRGLIKEKLNEDADSEIATTSLRVSLACPLGKMRMSTPCRSSTCSHLQCFDASLFLQMNERKPTWSCPVCDKPALYDNLVIDGYFQDVLSSSKLLPDVNEIQLLQDGSWENLVLKKEKDKDKELKSEINSHNKIDVDTVDLDESNPISPTPKEKKRAVIIDLISDSDDEDSNPSQSSNKKFASGLTSPQKSSVHSAISSTSRCHPQDPGSNPMVQSHFIISSGMRSSVRVRNVADAVIASAQNSPERSACSLTADHGISQSPIMRILKNRQSQPQRTQLHQESDKEDTIRNCKFCKWLIDKDRSEKDFIRQILWTDQTTFTNEAIVQHRNNHGNAEGSSTTQETQAEAVWSINVWAGIVGDRIIGPQFIEEQVDSSEASYRFLNVAVNELLEDLPLNVRQEIWFHHNCSGQDCSRIKEILDRTFPGKWIGPGNSDHEWPSESADLNPVNFFLWNYVKRVVYVTRPQCPEDLKKRIIDACAKITPRILRTLEASIISRALFFIQEQQSS
ncbi:E3 SUMO-protein ligase PIAS2 isoform X3 [Cephus cinctus]|nr:E3 SUMO-protein ligase PIAS2 isoform X3 [Cephus cinctus]XP_015593607.1 E3 SUMO-protein ligase PIAS2 isoform X3 [Cephus cinctus]